MKEIISSMEEQFHQGSQKGVSFLTIAISFRGRKMNSSLEAAIQEAMLELDRPVSPQSHEESEQPVTPNKATNENAVNSKVMPTTPQGSKSATSQGNKALPTTPQGVKSPISKENNGNPSTVTAQDEGLPPYSNILSPKLLKNEDLISAVNESNDLRIGTQSNTAASCSPNVGDAIAALNLTTGSNIGAQHRNHHKKTRVKVK